MRILHILNHTRRLNGHVHAAVDLACAQAKAGHAVCVGSGGGDFDDLLRRNGVAIARVAHERRPLTLLRSAIALRGTVRGFRADVVHAHMMTSAVLSYPICKLAGVPLVTTVHNEFERSAIFMGLGTRVIAVSEAVGVSMQKRGIAASKLNVVLNGTIGSSRFDKRCGAPAALTSPSILFVGGLHSRKGLLDLFQAFDIVHRQHPQARLYIVGDGPSRASYEAMVAELHCAKSVTFVGAIDDPYPYMLAADIFVLASLADPAPLVLSEAREARCAIVGTKIDGIPQLLEHGDAGILVPVRDPVALAAALSHLLATPGQIDEWKERSQVRIEHLTIDRVARETMQVYMRALSLRTNATAAQP